MKHKKRFSTFAACVALIVIMSNNWGRTWDTAPISSAWHRDVKIVYLDLGMSSAVRLDTQNILSSTLPGLRGAIPNQINIQSGSCTSAITEIVQQFDALEPKSTKASIDVRVVFIFTRVDGFSVLLAADSAGNFEWANIKRALPTLEQRKSLWKALPFEVVAKHPGPLEEEK